MSEEQSIDQICQAWWEELPQRPGDRARLRRAGGTADAMMVAATHRLADRLRPLGVTSARRTALLAILLAQAKHCESSGATLPTRLGESRGDRARFSEARFRRLLRAANEEDLLLQMRRAIRILDDAIHLPSLVDAVRYWSFDPDKHVPTMIQWASEYFAKVPRPKPVHT